MKLLEQCIQDNKIISKFQDLSKTIESNTSQENKNRYNKLDIMVTQCQKFSEKKCLKTKGQYPWYPTLMHTGWKLREINSVILYQNYSYTLPYVITYFISKYNPVLITASLQ